MKLIPLADIFISPERQRRTFDPAALNELKESIQTNGLFNAVVLRPRRAEEGEGLALSSGERRLRAIRDLWELGGQLRYDNAVIEEGMIPYVELGDLNPLEAEICELEENLKRADLTWQEEAAATARIAKLRASLAHSVGTSPPTTAEISTEVRGSADGWNQEQTRREIIVAQHLHKPEVRAAKSLDEAFKVLKRAETVEKNVRLAETVGRTFSVESHNAVNADALAWLRDAAAEQFDVILTDPPYGMGADEFGDSGVTGQRLGIAEHGYADSREVFVECRAALLEHALRVMKPQAHLYMFCDVDYFLESRDLFSACGWWVHRTPLIWHKPNALRVPWPEHGPRRSYELILYAVKGKRPVTKISPDVISCPQDENLGHSAQKPVALYRELLSRSVRPGDRVLDPFCGTGPIFPAAHELKCYATGVEKDAGSYGIALRRLATIRDQEQMEAQL